VRDSLSQISTFTEPTATRAEKAELPFPHNHVDLPRLVSVEVAEVCIPIGISEILLAAVYKSPGRAWSDANITELLNLRRKSILAGDLKAKKPFWNSADSNPSGQKLLYLFDVNQFEISALQCPIHYSPSGNSDMLDIVVHQNTRVSDVIVFDILDSDRLPIPHTGSCQN
jgi:hypothetical protein